MSSRPKKIAIFLPNLDFGGAERAMLKLAGGLASRGLSVDLVLCAARGPYLAEVPRSVRLVDLHASRTVVSIPALVGYLRRERPAAVLSGLHANLIVLWARRLARVPTRIVVSERNMIWPRIRNSRSSRLSMMPYLIRRFYPWADGIVAVSQGVADELSTILGLPAGRIEVIYNPIVTPELLTKAQALLEHPWFGPGQPPVILAIGRLTAQKDFPSLIEAFVRVRRKRPAKLIILGDGQERPALESLIARAGVGDDVSLPGFVLNPLPYLVRASLFVLSSKWEGLPGVLIEALFCGTPVIATDCPSGPREILDGGRYGPLVPVGDPEALAAAICAGLDGEMRRPPRESWRRFELDAVVDQYVDLLVGSRP